MSWYRKRLLPQEQLRAIFARTKHRGLRATINALRAKRHKASDWRTLYHGTHRRNVGSILESGIQAPPQGHVFLGTRDTAKFFAGWRNRTLPSAIVKVRVAKQDISGPERAIFLRGGKWRRQYRSKKSIHPSAIRKVEFI